MRQPGPTRQDLEDLAYTRDWLDRLYASEQDSPAIDSTAVDQLDIDEPEPPRRGGWLARLAERQLPAKDLTPNSASSL